MPSKDIERRREVDRAYHDRHRDRINARQRELYKIEYSTNPGRIQTKVYLRKARRKSAMPSWVNKEEIYAFYSKCPKGYTVDHIIPLKGETVCGLHVLGNLQYLTRSENAKKGNRFYG